MDFPSSLITSLQNSQRIVALTGAGISAESGLATFREAQTGLWSKFRPEELATGEAFRRNPKLVWDWYRWRREQALKAKPNPGHLALVEIEKRAPEFLLVTQNVDGFHARAGSKRIVELHGNLDRFRCFENDCASNNFDVENGRCRSCGGNLRPDVVWFGETLRLLLKSIKIQRHLLLSPTIRFSAKPAKFCRHLLNRFMFTKIAALSSIFRAFISRCAP